MSSEPAIIKEPSVHDIEHELWRLNLLKNNLLAWKEKPNLGQNLDSNIKRNTGFIKKCRLSLNAENCSSMVKEVNQLKLEKYISEVVVAISEGILKCKTLPNVIAAVEVISALHQKFPSTFTVEIFDIFRKLLSTPPKQSLSATLSLTDREREEASRIVRQRTILKVVTEVWLVGVFWGIENGVVANLTNSKESLDSLLEHVSNHTVVNKDLVLHVNLGSTNPSLKNNRLGLIYHSLKDLLAIDREKFSSISLAVTFLKSFGSSILQVTPSTASTTSTEPQGVVGLLTSEHVEAFKELFLDYAKDLSKYLMQEHKTVKREERGINERYISRGEINETFKAKFEANFKLYEKHVQSMQIMTSCLNIPMPDLPSQLDDDSNGIVIVNDGSSNKNGLEDPTNLESSPWEDEDARSFYEKLLDLKSVLPSILLGTNPHGNSTTTTETKSEAKGKVRSPQLDPAPSPLPTSPEEPELFNVNLELLEEGEADLDEERVGGEVEIVGEDAADTIEKLSASAPMTNFLAKLPTIGNRELIDQAAIDFCYLNNKASRNRLILHLKQVPLQRTDLLSHYARFIATLHPYFPDILTNVLKELEKEFRGTVRRKTSTVGSILLERRNLNIRYYAELTKFNLIPAQFALFLIKSLLDHFQNPGNVEVLCTYLEVAGRFLNKSPSTAQRTAAMLDILMRKKNANKNLDERLKTMIENAFYQCNPPAHTQSLQKVKVRGKVETFLRHILLVSLLDRPLERTLKILRKLEWIPTGNKQQFTFIKDKNIKEIVQHDNEKNMSEASDEVQVNEKVNNSAAENEPGVEPEVTASNQPNINENHYYIMFKLFTKIHKHKFNHVESLANLLGSLTKFHPDFAIEVVDQLLEDIRIGLEENSFQYAQKRLSQVKYLSELANYKVIEFKVILDTLYTILTLGYSNGRPYLGAINQLDLPTDFIRIRLVCTILDSCGTNLDKLGFKKQLDDFLIFFQTYILTKSNVPLDVQFAISDSFEALRPNLKLLESYEEANLLVEEMLNKNVEATAINFETQADQAPKTSDAGTNGADSLDLDLKGSETDSETDSDSDSSTSDAATNSSENSGTSTTSSSVELEQMNPDFTDPIVLLNQKKLEVELEQERLLQKMEEEEFEREYQAMLTASNESRKGFERKQGVLDVPIPMKLINDKKEGGIDTKDQVKFSLLTKRGNKQQVKTMAVPSNSALVISTTHQQQLEKVEQQQLKRIVLRYEDSQDKDPKLELDSLHHQQDTALGQLKSNFPRGQGRNNKKPTDQGLGLEFQGERKATGLTTSNLKAFPPLPNQSTTSQGSPLPNPAKAPTEQSTASNLKNHPGSSVGRRPSRSAN